MNPRRDRPSASTRRTVRPPTPARPGKSNRVPWLAACGVVLLLVLGGFLLFGSNPAPAPPPPPPPAAKRPAPPPTPAPAATAAPVDTGPDEPAARMKWLERRQSASPTEFKRWHDEWTALLPRVTGTKLESEVRNELERIEGAAHKEFRTRFRPIRERINALLEERKALEAAHLLREWKLPEELNVSGTIRADLDGEVRRLQQIAAIDDIAASAASSFKAGSDPGDPRDLLAAYLKSPDIGIRMPAEHALRRLTFLGAARRFRIAMDGRRTASESRIAALRLELSAEAEARKRRIEQWERRLQESTKSAPLTSQALGLSGSMQFRILKFDGDHLTYGNSSAELKTSLLTLKPSAIGQLLELAADPRDADGLLEAGRVAVRAGALDSADRLIRGAVRLKPAFESTAPSVDKIRRGVGLLRGKAEVVGDRVSVAYAFERQEEAEDFKPVTKLAAEVSGGALRLGRKDSVFLADLGNVDFSGRLKLRLKTAGVEGSGAYAFGFRWEVSPGDADLLLVVAFPNDIRVTTFEGYEKPVVRKELRLEKPAADFELSLNRQQCDLKIGGLTVWSDIVAANADIRAIVGGVSVNDGPEAGVAYASIDVEGRGAPSWIRAIRSERRALVEGELSKELKSLASSAAKAPDEREFGDELGRPLPVEEAFAEAYTDEAKKALGEWRRRLGEWSGAKRSDDLSAKAAAVAAALDEVIRHAPWLPLGYYHRAEWKYVMGDPQGALADLDESLSRHENFVEAHVAKADLFQELWRFEDAAKSIDAALAAVPDLARPRLTRALLHYYGDRGEAAGQELGLAIRLAPDNLGLRLEALRLERIVAGPRWPQEIRIDTDHYLVRAELAAGSSKEAAEARDRANRAARTLEITRTWFEEIIPGTGRRTRKPIVYLFQSPESYYVHADLAHGDRLEHSLGVFFPRYQQMCFFLGASEEETISTMVHESFHEYIRSLAGATPPWFNEGFAEYASSAAIANGKVTKAGALLPDRVATLRRALKRDFKGVPFRRIMTETQRQFMAVDPPLRYAQSWSMIHFLMHSGNEKYRAALDAYIRGLLERTPPRKLVESAFQGIDFKQLQEEWLEYVKKW